MERDPISADAARTINALRDTEAIKAVETLIERMIFEARVKNDTESRINVLRNQGEIKGLQRLLDYMRKPLPVR